MYGVGPAGRTVTGREHEEEDNACLLLFDRKMTRSYVWKCSIPPLDCILIPKLGRITTAAGTSKKFTIVKCNSGYAGKICRPFGRPSQLRVPSPGIPALEFTIPVVIDGQKTDPALGLD